MIFLIHTISELCFQKVMLSRTNSQITNPRRALTTGQQCALCALLGFICRKSFVLARVASPPSFPQMLPPPEPSKPLSLPLECIPKPSELLSLYVAQSYRMFQNINAYCNPISSLLSPLSFDFSLNMYFNVYCLFPNFTFTFFQNL